MKTHTSHDKGGGHAFPGQAPAPAWPWVTAWPGPSQRQPPRSLPEPPDAPTATPHSGVRYIRLPRRGTARGAALAAPTGSGEGGEDGSGDAGDAHGTPSGVVGSAKFRTPSGRHWHATSGT